jgi:Tfp pilus assembly protein PilN
MSPAKQSSVNLIGEEEMEHTPGGRIVMWAVTYGRYIMIGTEIIVLLAFISRFSLDRNLTDLNDEVSQKQAIIDANRDFEANFLTIQDKLTNVQALLTSPSVTSNALNTIQAMLPIDAHLEELNIETGRVVGKVVANTTAGFSQMVANLQAASIFSQVEIGDVKRSPTTGIQFTFTGTIAGPKKGK